MNDKIDVKFGSLFPWPFRLIAVVVLVVGLSLILEKTFLSIGLILIGGFILSGAEGTEINRTEKELPGLQILFLHEERTQKKVFWDRKNICKHVKNAAGILHDTYQSFVNL